MDRRKLPKVKTARMQKNNTKVIYYPVVYYEPKDENNNIISSKGWMLSHRASTKLKGDENNLMILYNFFIF